MCGFLFGGSGSPPPPPPLPPLPTIEDPSVQEAADKERRRRLAALGRPGTILTGGQGLLQPANVARKQLLGQ